MSQEQLRPDTQKHLCADDVIVTDEMDRRSSRAPGHEAEALALRILALPSKPEVTRGKPNELVTLQRRTARKSGLPQRPDEAGQTLGEKLSAHAGHLALSAIAGAGYGLVKRDGAPVASGLTFGLGFYALAYGVVAPALGIWPSPWRDRPSSLAQHLFMHGLFGVVTAVVADKAARRI